MLLLLLSLCNSFSLEKKSGGQRDKVYFYLLFWPTFFQCHFYLYIVSLLLTCTILKVNKLTTLELTIPMGADKPKRNELYVQPADDIRWVTYLI